MRVAHIGPPLARQGGPAGYLLQLQHAAAEAEGMTPSAERPALDGRGAVARAHLTLVASGEKRESVLTITYPILIN